ncbi:MAG TPA: restriction endonuclease [Eubacterium sp.]|nr:restriction endonuclease [Eubacterium sp.]HCO34628.1 restriction endonuclease [Eubacterium sp.]
MELAEDVFIRCNRCGCIIEIQKDEIEFETYVYDHGDNGMGEEIEYRHDGCVICDKCGNEINFLISGSEYPVGAYNYDNNEIEGGKFVEAPNMIVVYSVDEFDLCDVAPEFDRVEQLMLDIDENRQLIYDVSSREFEEIIERLFQNEGFETFLTPATRDGGRDIIATKYELGKPIVFYVECKKFGRRNSAGVSIVRALYGVQSSDRINKSILVTTGHLTSEARRFVEKQNTMMSVIEVEEIHELIRKSANRYRRY